MLTIAVSTRALFNLGDGHAIFVESGQAAFDLYMKENELKPLRPGASFSVVKKLLALNDGRPAPEVQVVLLSSNSHSAGLRVMQSIQHHALDISKAVFSGGSERYRYAKAFGVHLFLSTNEEEARRASMAGVPCAILSATEPNTVSDTELRVAFDGDAVIFSGEAEHVYQTQGLAAFNLSEQRNAGRPLSKGPLEPLLVALSKLRNEGAPIRTALVTARGVAAHERALRTLESWDVKMDEAIFADGFNKGLLLEAFGAELFFDDTLRHINNARPFVLSGHVPPACSHN